MQRLIRASRNQLTAVREAFRPLGEPFREHGAPRPQRFAVVFIFRKVAFLTRVTGQIEEVFRTVAGAPNVFETTVGQRMKRLCLAVTRRVLEMQPWPDYAVLSSEYR